jgi:heterodisulfide reductase subunit B
MVLKMNKYGLFLGCTVPVRAMNYEASFRKVAESLNINLFDISDFSCCGFPTKSVSLVTALTLSARNLAIAERESLTHVLTLCNACTEMLTETNHIIKENSKISDDIRRNLNELGLTVSGNVKVKHIARFLSEDIGAEAVKEKVINPLNGLKFAVYPGCHYAKPSEIYENFDDPELPHSINELVLATGSEVIPYESSCCGGGILGIKEEVALSMSNSTLASIKENSADAMVLICPFCNVMYEQNQKKIEKTFNTEYNLPVLYLPQVLGLAFGIPKEELGFQINRIKTDRVFEKISLNS